LGGPAPPHIHPGRNRCLVGTGRDAKIGSLPVSVSVELGLADPERDSGEFGEQVRATASELTQLLDSDNAPLGSIEAVADQMPGHARELCQVHPVGLGLSHRANNTELCSSLARSGAGLVLIPA
jgi:hypothetical protein